MYGDVGKFFWTEKLPFANNASLNRSKSSEFKVFDFFSRVEIHMYSVLLLVWIFIYDSSFDSLLCCCILARAWSYMYFPQYFILARLGSRSVFVSRGQINFNPADELLQCTEAGLYYLETNQHLLMLPFYYKPFDSVPHQRLLLKSKSYRIEGGLQEWF